MDETDIDDPAELHPLLTRELQDQVTKGLEKSGVKLEATNDDWSRLEQILQRYDDHARFWAGFPNKGDAQKLLDTGKKAKKLAAALTALNEEGYSAIIREQVGGHDIGVFISALQLLSEMDVRSPKTEDDEKPSWHAVLDQCAAAMQIELDRWWQDVTGEDPTVVVGYDSPYTYFLKQIFGCLSGSRLGGSRTAVEARRRTFRKQEIKMFEAGRTFRRP